MSNGRPSKEEENISCGKGCSIVLIGAVITFSVIFVLGQIFGWPERERPREERRYEPQEPKGLEAVTPSMRPFVKQVAEEHGVSYEEARQALRKGSLKGYPDSKIYGK